LPVGDGPAATDDPVTRAVRNAEAAKANAATEAERARGAERRWPEVSQVARDRATPVKARLEALRAYAETYAGTDWAREAEKLMVSLEAEQARSVQAEARAAEEATRLEKESRRSSSADMVLVRAGEFFYGCNARVDGECFDDEQPGQTMSLPAFRIDRTEVTVAAYKACVDAGRCTAPDNGGSCNWATSRADHPVNCVDWNQARTYCAWKGKRLPTEQEWEKAARGTDGRKYAWGNEGASSGRFANLEGHADGWAHTSPAGAFRAGLSAYGAEDMIGNVWEWCENDYSPERKSLRGASSGSVARVARASNRGRDGPGVRSEFIGFRCAQSAE
jgi:formylglycine-generating enzyme required for sulfatase activity